MAQPNGLNPNFYSASFTNGGSIFGGVMATAGSIAAEVGLAAGGLYLSASGSGAVWFCDGVVWISKID